MRFTPTSVVHECLMCARRFIVSEEAITDWIDDKHAQTREDAIDFVLWCSECIDGTPHPEERPKR